VAAWVFPKWEGTTVNIKDKVVDDFNGWVHTTSNFQHAGVGVLGTLGIRRFFCSGFHVRFKAITKREVERGEKHGG
jgi:hypothetical protein